MLLSVSFLSLACPRPAQALDDAALPTGGQVAAGQAQLDYGAPGKLDVRQSTDRAVINWDSFNIGKNATTTFHQPSSKSLTVNRVTGNHLDPTRILGTLKANGNVAVLDRNGVIFGPDSRVDVGGIVASSGAVTDQDVMAGGAITITDVAAGGPVINAGYIKVADGGLAAFVAPQVVNAGIIAARMGTMHMAAGTQATLDLYGDGLFELAVDERLENALVSNGGIISAQGGVVHLSTAAAKDVVNGLVNVDGIIDVSSAREEGGKIILEGSHVAVSGVMDASGATGGGEILIGGDYLGRGDTRTAAQTIVTKQAVIRADATEQGDGGKVIVWSDDTTVYEGSISARGGAAGGDGGFVETSGKERLKAQGQVDLTAAQGQKGVYLLDPADITIVGDFDPTDIDGLEFWADASQIDGLNDGDSVMVWEDLSGNGNHATAGDPSNAPTYVASDQNGLPVVHFDGVDDFLLSDTFLSAFADGMTISVMTKPEVLETSDGVVMWRGPAPASGLNLGYPNAGATWGYVWNNDGSTYWWTDGPAVAQNQYQHVMALIDPSSTTITLNDQDSGTNIYPSPYLNDGTTPMTIGRDPLGGARHFQGSLAEIILYNRDLNADEALLINQYQAAKWNVNMLAPDAATEAAMAMDADDGFSVFTTRYLEHLSQTADIVLLASNDITLDFKGDTLTLVDERSITLTAGNDINIVSDGTIATRRLTTGGNITMDAGNDVNFDAEMTFDLKGNGQLHVIAQAGDISINEDMTILSDHWQHALFDAGRDINIMADVEMGMAGHLHFTAGQAGVGDLYVNGDITLNDGVGMGDLLLQASRHVTVQDATLNAHTIWLNAAGGNAGGTGRLSINNSFLDFDGRAAWRLNLITGNGGRGDIVLDDSWILNADNGSNLVNVHGWNDITVNMDMNTNYVWQFTAYNKLYLNNPYVSTYIGGGGLTWTGTNGIELAADFTMAELGSVTFIGDMTVVGDRTITHNTASSTSPIYMIGTINGRDGGESLTINGGQGEVRLYDSVGAVNPLGDLTITADTVTLEADMAGTGTLTLQPYTAGRSIGVNGIGDFNLSAVEIGYFGDTWDEIIIGRSNGTGAVDIGDSVFEAPVTIQGGTVDITGNFQTPYARSDVYARTGDITFNAAQSFGGVFGSRTFSAFGDIYVNNPITMTGDGGFPTLVLNANLGPTGNVYINSDIFSHEGIHITAQNDIHVDGALAAHGAGSLMLQAANNDVNGTGQLFLNDTLTWYGGRLVLVTGYDGAGNRQNLDFNAATFDMQAPGGSANTSIRGYQDVTFNRAGMFHSLTVEAFGRLTFNEVFTPVNGNIYNFTAGGGIFLNNDIVYSPSGILTNRLHFNSAVTLGADVTIDNADGEIWFYDTVDSDATPRSLTVVSGTRAAFYDDVGGQQALDNLSVTTNDIIIDADLNGTGVLHLQPATASRSIGIDGTGDFNLTAAEVGHLGGDWDEIIIGRSNGTGAVDIGDSVFEAPVTIQGGSVTVNGNYQALAGSTVHAYSGDIRFAGSGINMTAPLLLTGHTYNAFGNIYIDSAIDVAASLAFYAGTGGPADIFVNDSVRAPGGVYMHANRHIFVDAPVITESTGNIDLEASSGDSNGVGALYLNDALHWSAGEVMLTSGRDENGDRPDLIFDETHFVNANNYNIRWLNLNGFNDIVINRTFEATLALNLHALNNLIINAPVLKSGDWGFYISAGNEIRLNTHTIGGVGDNFAIAGDIVLGDDVTINVLGGLGLGFDAIDGDGVTGRSLTVNGGDGWLHFDGAVGSNVALSDLTVTARDVVINADMRGTGVLTLQPSTTSQVVRVNAGAGDFNLDTDEIDRIQNGWDEIRIGRADSGADLLVGTSTWKHDVTFLNNFRQTLQNVHTTTNGASITYDSGWIDLFLTTLDADGAVSFLTWEASHGIYNYQSLTITSANAPVLFDDRLVNNGGMTIDAGTGTVHFEGDLQDTGALTVRAGAVTTGAAAVWGSALTKHGDIDIATRDSLVLPEIHARSLFARTTGATSDITLRGPVTVDEDLTLVAARNFINQAGASALQSANQRWLVYSTDAAANDDDGMMSDFSLNACLYGGPCPALEAGNGYLYSVGLTPPPPPPPPPGPDPHKPPTVPEVLLAFDLYHERWIEESYEAQHKTTAIPLTLRYGAGESGGDGGIDLPCLVMQMGVGCVMR